MRAPILDEATYNAVVQIMALCRARGHNVPEALHSHGLLWTPDRERQVKAQTVSWILEEFQNWQAHEFLRRTKKDLSNATPADMYLAILGWLQDHVAYIRNPTPQPMSAQSD